MWQCQTCAQAFLTKKDMKGHMKISHPEPLPDKGGLWLWLRLSLRISHVRMSCVEVGTSLGDQDGSESGLVC
jgi:hypothetical protein